MISVLILTEGLSLPRRAQAVTQSLAALVPLAVDGLIRDAHVVSPDEISQLTEIAEDSGADLYLDVAPALASAKSQRVLVLQAGALMNPALAQEIWQKGLTRPDGHAARLYAAPIRLHHFIVPSCVGLIAAKADLQTLVPFRFDSAKRKIKAPLRLKAALQMAD